MCSKNKTIALDDVFSKNIPNGLKDHIEDISINKSSNDDENFIEEIDHNDIRIYELELSRKKLRIGKIQTGRILTIAISIGIIALASVCFF